MILRLFPTNGFHSESEHRLIQKFEATKLEVDKGETETTFKEKNGPGAQEFVDHFFDQDEASDEELTDYLDSRLSENNDLTPFEKRLEEYLQKKNDDSKTNNQRIEAESAIDSIFSYIKKRRTLLDQSKKSLNALSEKTGLPPAMDATFSTAKSAAGSSIELFKEANGVDKTLMLAGSAAVIALCIFMYQKAKKNAPGTTGLASSAVLIGLGGGAMYMAYEAVNRTATKVKGRPLTDAGNAGTTIGPITAPIATHTNEEWQAQNNENQIQEVKNALKQARVPQSFVEEITSSVDDQHTVKGIANISAMDVTEFQDLYENHKEDKNIPAEDFPTSPCPTDPKHPEFDLSPLERFLLVKEIGTTMGLIDADGEFIPPTEKRQDKSMLYLMLDWQKQ